MLFSYEHVPHSMDKMQKFMDFIFFQVWFPAKPSQPFDLELFNGEQDLKDVMTSFYYGDTKGGDLFYSRVEKIYDFFAKLSKSQRKKMRKWYWANNLVERACCNDPIVCPIRYKDMKGFDPKLIKALKELFTALYSQSLIGLKALRDKIGNIDDHYNEFSKVNKALKCPFCGITDVLGTYHEKHREAYDHYLPKSIYPFNSVNFKNLAPACHHCNSTYKTTKDPNYKPKDRLGVAARRKAFYPYSSRDRLEVSVEIDDKADVDKLTPDDISLGFGPNDFDEEIETWNEIYGIDERYKAKLCDDDARDWLEQFLILNRSCGMTADAFLQTVDEQFAKKPLANNNFLKRAFLHGCSDIGALQAIAVHAPAP